MLFYLLCSYNDSIVIQIKEKTKTSLVEEKAQVKFNILHDKQLYLQNKVIDNKSYVQIIRLKGHLGKVDQLLVIEGLSACPRFDHNSPTDNILQE